MKIRKGLLLILAIILAGSARMQAIDYTSMLLPSLTSDDPESIEKFIRDFSRILRDGNGKEFPTDIENIVRMPKEA